MPDQVTHGVRFASGTVVSPANTATSRPARSATSTATVRSPARPMPPPGSRSPTTTTPRQGIRTEEEQLGRGGTRGRTRPGSATGGAELAPEVEEECARALQVLRSSSAPTGRWPPRRSPLRLGAGPATSPLPPLAPTWRGTRSWRPRWPTAWSGSPSSRRIRGIFPTPGGRSAVPGTSTRRAAPTPPAPFVIAEASTSRLIRIPVWSAGSGPTSGGRWAGWKPRT